MTGHLPRGFPSKLGAWDPSGAWVPVSYDNCFLPEQVSGFHRLLVATSGEGVDLFVELAALFEAPYRLAYLLMTEIGGRQPGRFELSSVSLTELREILQRFHDFLSSDARHHLWLHADGGGTLILDEHDWIYVYGNLDAVTEKLKLQGFKSCAPELPFPHVHNESPSNHSVMEQLLNSYPWQQVPVSNLT